MTRGNAPAEQRAFGRRESRIHAFVKVPGRRPEPCIVRNISEGGALLAFPAPFDPPARFRLTIDAKGIDVNCEVRRRNGLEFGVEFVDRRTEFDDKLLKAIIAPPPEPTTDTIPNLLGTGGIVLVVPAHVIRTNIVL